MTPLKIAALLLFVLCPLIAALEGSERTGGCEENECLQDNVLHLALSKPLGLILNAPIVEGEPTNGVVVSALNHNHGSAHALSVDLQEDLLGSRIVSINNESMSDLFISEVIDYISNTNGTMDIEFDVGTRNTATVSSWDELLRSGEAVVANGNVWPPQPNERRDSCLLLATHSQIIRSCPFESESGSYEVLYKDTDRRFRGIFAADVTEPYETPSKPRRLWLLSSPMGTGVDLLEELDVELGRIVQTLLVPGTIDGHDAVRVGGSVFIVDTHHGDIVELALPKSVPPQNDREVLVEEKSLSDLEKATVIHRHSGFTRYDHINNVAVHRDVLLANLHGKNKLKAYIQAMHGGVSSPTRLSVLRRDLSATEVLDERFRPVENAGKWCHGVAFWQDEQSKAIKLISLDSKNGSLVSVTLSGSGSEMRERQVLWEPDMSHPVLQPPKDSTEGYANGFAFAKGLAVQGGVAFFGVAGARQRKGRLSINPTLLVAVDLATGEELFVHEVQSHGLINQVVSESYLAYNERSLDQQEIDTLPSKVDVLAMVNEEFPMLSTFDHFHSGRRSICHDENLKTFELPLTVKTPKVMKELKNEHDPHKIVSYLCNLDVSPVTGKLLAMWNGVWYDDDHAQKTNARFENRAANMAKFKPGVKAAVLIFSDRHGKDVYHFPWLKEWLPLIQENVLSPLQIKLKSVVRMQMALMAPGSTINKHKDTGMWVKRTHRTHVPLIAHNDTYFVTEIPEGSYLRIP